MRAAMAQDKLRTVYNQVAKRYDFQHGFLTAKSDQRGRELLVAKAVQSGDCILDCGAGTGSTSLLAAQKMGPEGRLVLFDLSEGMLAVAKEKLAQTQVPDRIEFKVGDMLQLPFEDNGFDVVLSTYSLCPVVDPALGARELYRVTKPGGHIGVAHSAEPSSAWLKWLSDRVEDVVWQLPFVSLGCRSVSVLPTFEKLGCAITFQKQIGVPLWPFWVFVVQKPAL